MLKGYTRHRVRQAPTWNYLGHFPSGYASVALDGGFTTIGLHTRPIVAAMLRNVARPNLALPSLTAVIITRNEADRIGTCLAALTFCEAILVVDSGSSDETVALARAAGAKVVETDWPGFVAQKSRAFGMADTEWVLSVDADEVVDPKLATAIRDAIGATEFDGYELSRRNIWLGHALRGGFASPDRRLRLVRRTKARWAGRDPHDRLEVTGKVGQLSGELIHNSYRSLGDHFARIDRYTRIDARRGTLVDLAFRPIWHLVVALIPKRGLQDGVHGVFYALLGALYVALKWGRWRFDPSVFQSKSAK